MSMDVRACGMEDAIEKEKEKERWEEEREKKWEERCREMDAEIAAKEKEEREIERLYYTNGRELIVQAGWDWADDVSLVPEAETGSCCPLGTKAWEEKGFIQIDEDEARNLYEEKTEYEFPECWENVA